MIKKNPIESFNTQAQSKYVSVHSQSYIWPRKSRIWKHASPIFLGGAEDLFLVQLTLLIQKITQKTLLGPFLRKAPKMHCNTMHCDTIDTVKSVNTVNIVNMVNSVDTVMTLNTVTTLNAVTTVTKVTINTVNGQYG